MARMNWSTLSGGRGPLPREGSEGGASRKRKRRKAKRKKKEGGHRPDIKQLAASLKKVLDWKDKATAERQARLEAMRRE